MGKGIFKKPNLVPKAKLQAKKQNNKKKEVDNSEFDDETDAFMSSRNKVSLNDEYQDSDEEGVEPVMDLDLPDSDEDEDEDDDEDDDDTGLNLRAKMHLKKYMNKDDDDEEEEEQDDNLDEMYDNKWGKSKRMYYNADTTTDNKDRYRPDFDKDEAENEEEAEAKRLQAKRAQQRSDADFDDDLQIEQNGDAEPENEEEMTLEQRLKQKGKKKEHSSSESKLLQSVKNDLDSINFDLMNTNGDMVVESVRKDMSQLTKEEKLELILNDSPELLQLLEEFNKNIVEIKEKLSPLLKKVKTGELPTSQGVSFLEVKYHLMLSYCTNITFYLMMKASGKSVKDHPVIDQLVRIRTVLEKLKPLDKKLSYQINKLLTLASSGTAQVDENDPRSYRPNPEAMISDGEEENEEIPVEKAEKYKVPKISEMHFDEKSIDNKRRKEDRDRKRAEKSSMMKFIRQEYGEEPEEEPVIGATRQDTDPEMRKRIEFEEDMYMRLALTKEDKKRMNKKEREFDELQSLADFGDIASVAKQKDDPNTILTKKTIRDVITKIQDNKKDERKRKAFFDAGDRLTPEEPDFDIEDDDLEFGKQKKQKKQKMNKNKVQFIDEKETEPIDEESEGEDNQFKGGKRAISTNIDKNRGLTRSRNKETKTPHTRMRNKYDKALQKRRGTVRKMADKSKPYGGESTGIRSNVIHSRKLKF